MVNVKIENWPVFEDCEPVQVGSKVLLSDGMEHVVEHIDLFSSLAILYFDDTNECVTYSPLNGEKLKHMQRPVYDMDNVEIEKCDTVYLLESREPYKVEGVFRNMSDMVELTDKNGGRLSTFATMLTHQRPDSWEMVERDATKPPREYCRENGISAETVGAMDDERAIASFATNLVHRAKLLAGTEADIDEDEDGEDEYGFIFFPYQSD